MTRAPARRTAVLTSVLTVCSCVAAEAAADTCPVVIPHPIAPRFSTDIVIPAGATEVRADAVELVEDGVSVFSGDVEVVRSGSTLGADRVTWRESEDRFRFDGNARLWSDDILWAGSRGEFDLDAEQAVLEQGRYWLTDGLAHGRATVIERDDGAEITTLVDVDYSTCEEPDPDWRLSASRIRLDHAASRGSARNIVLRAGEMPVFWFPYLTFPLSDERKSGLLVPTLRSSSESGFDLRVPFYWNIAPNYDATITPRTITDRGGMLETQFRYLFQQGEGQLEFAALPEDDLFEDRARGLIVFRHRQAFATGRGWLRADINQVSDEQYFEDLGNSLGVTSTRFLNRDIEAYYAQNYWNVRGFIQNFQTVDPSLPAESRPYRRLPQVTFATHTARGNNRLNAVLTAQTTYFQRSDSVTGGRIHLEPQVYFALRDAGRFLIPRLKIRQTYYFLDDNDFSNDDSPDRTLPVFSLDTGLIAERRFEAFGESLLQTLEPRAFYLYIPETDQSDIPVFDSAEYDFNFQNLFRDNRFAGNDRVGDANQLTLALTSRILNRDNGAERLRIAVGQILYFRDREVTLPDAPVEGDDVSEFIGEVAAEIASGWRARATLQWDPKESQTEKLALDLNYRPDSGTVLNLSYRLRRALTDVEQTDVSFQYPVTERWSVVGRWNYSLKNSRTLELVGGIEYDSCCWGLRLGGRRFIRNVQGEFDNAFFVQIHLKGLAGLGSNTLSFLQNQIPGYYTRF